VTGHTVQICCATATATASASAAHQPQHHAAHCIATNDCCCHCYSYRPDPWTPHKASQNLACAPTLPLQPSDCAPLAQAPAAHVPTPITRQAYLHVVPCGWAGRTWVWVAVEVAQAPRDHCHWHAHQPAEAGQLLLSPASPCESLNMCSNTHHPTELPTCMDDDSKQPLAWPCKSLNRPCCKRTPHGVNQDIALVASGKREWHIMELLLHAILSM
jgi:hypothetical protein